MALELCVKNAESPLIKLVLESFRNELTSYELEERLEVYEIICEYSYTHIEALKKQILEDLEERLPNLDDERLEGLQASDEAEALIVIEKKKRRRKKLAEASGSLQEALDIITNIKNADADDATQILEPWLDEASVQNDFETCLALANITWKLRRNYVCPEGLGLITSSLYKALVKRAKKLYRPMEDPIKEAKTFKHVLGLEDEVGIDIFGNHCTREAISHDTIGGVLRKRGWPIDEGAQLRRAAQLFTEGGDGSFGNLLAIYFNRERLGLDRQVIVDLVNKLAEHVDECFLPRVYLLLLYNDNWDNPELADAVEIFLRKLAESL
jgi:hypothetical protein